MNVLCGNMTPMTLSPQDVLGVDVQPGGWAVLIDVPLAPWGSLSAKSPGKGWGTVCKIGKENSELTHGYKAQDISI